MTASAVWARGKAFSQVARMVQSSLGPPTTLASVAAFTGALACSSSCSASSGAEVEFLACDSVSENVFASVGGNVEAKIALEDALALDSRRLGVLTSLGLTPPSGILLYGPPGNGKTLLARTVARFLQSRNAQTMLIGGAFVSLSSTDLVRAEVGTGEKMLLEAFKAARSNAPSVLFLDEFQALFIERGSGGSGRLSSTLLQCMDDITHWRDAEYKRRVFEDAASDANDTQIPQTVVLAATNTPWMIDRAFLRAGRFDRSVYVPLPSIDERVSILRIHTGRMKLACEDNGGLQLLCEALGSLTKGFSGADIAALCRAAAVRCLLEGKENVEEQHFLNAIESDVKPSTSESLLRRIHQWRP
jgi:SpoVK/Ycf46/Vps4 family AAA+-type ATPase